MINNIDLQQDNIDRETLEQLAIEACKPEIYYELQDSIQETTDLQLKLIIWGIL